MTKVQTIELIKEKVLEIFEPQIQHLLKNQLLCKEDIKDVSSARIEIGEFRTQNQKNKISHLPDEEYILEVEKRGAKLKVLTQKAEKLFNIFEDKYGKGEYFSNMKLVTKTSLEIEKEIRKYFNLKILKLTNQISKKIEDEQLISFNTHLDISGFINGEFKFTKKEKTLTFKITTIVASGIVQKAHYRTILKKA